MSVHRCLRREHGARCSSKLGEWYSDAKAHVEAFAGGVSTYRGWVLDFFTVSKSMWLKSTAPMAKEDSWQKEKKMPNKLPGASGGHSFMWNVLLRRRQERSERGRHFNEDVEDEHSYQLILSSQAQLSRRPLRIAGLLHRE